MTAVEETTVVEVAVSDYESLNDALAECVRVCGGYKAVGHVLWPALDVEAAGARLRACLNPERSEKLSPDESLLIMRMSRDRGCHVGMAYVAQNLSYSMPVAVTPQDEAAELQRQVLTMGETFQVQMEKMVERIERLNAPAQSRLRSAA